MCVYVCVFVSECYERVVFACIHVFLFVYVCAYVSVVCLLVCWGLCICVLGGEC